MTSMKFHFDDLMSLTFSLYRFHQMRHCHYKNKVVFKITLLTSECETNDYEIYYKYLFLFFTTSGVGCINVS